MAVAFAAKLRLAAATLGCSSRKEFCARFRSVNPATQCDIDRLNKWVQGRPLPRASSVYADFAAVIGSSQSRVPRPTVCRHAAIRAPQACSAAWRC